jgi:hypothetical protein
MYRAARYSGTHTATLISLVVALFAQSWRLFRFLLLLSNTLVENNARIIESSDTLLLGIRVGKPFASKVVPTSWW